MRNRMQLFWSLKTLKWLTRPRLAPHSPPNPSPAGKRVPGTPEPARWHPAVMKSCLRAILDDPEHRISVGLNHQHLIGLPGEEKSSPIPRSTLKDYYNKKLKPLIKRSRRGTGGDDISEAVAYLSTIYCSAYENSGRHLLHFRGIEEDVMAQHCRLAFNSGFPLDQLSLIALATALSEDKSRVIDVGWIQGFLNRHPDIKRLKASVIDWQRVDAANEENIKVYLKNFNAFNDRAKAAGAFEGDYWSPEQIFNYDEISSDPTKGRNSNAAKVFAGYDDGAASALSGNEKAGKKRNRPWDIAPSDHGLPFHVTVGSCPRRRRQGG